MATFVELYSERGRVLEAVVTANRNAEEWREQGYTAAVRIQSWFRGCRVRAYIRYLNECATVIQTVFRGHYARILYRRKLTDHLEMLRQAYYDNKATIIQKIWRGHYVRRYVHNYYAQKTYLEALERKNAIVRDQLDKYKEDVVTSQLARDDALHQLREIEEARRYHYMLSTEIKPGVFRHPEKGPLPFEQKMKGIKFAQEMKRHRRCRSEHSETSTGTEGKTPCIDLSASTGDCRLRRTTLPPLTQKKVQGPFTSPEKAWKQRLRPLNPTLRVATSFNSVDTARAELKAREQAKIVVDKQFLPFSKGSSCSPLIPTQSPYHRSAYGTKHFREEFKASLISQQYFRTVVPSIPIFDNLNS